jgi:hypothetical protein
LCGCRYPEFGSSEEAGAVQALLNAYDDGDEETLRNVLNLPIFKYLDNAVSQFSYLFILI